MVALLTGVGFVTSAFFFLSRDIYATIVFHNFLGVSASRRRSPHPDD